MSRKLIRAKEDIVRSHKSIYDNKYLDVDDFKGMEEIIRTLDRLSFNEISRYVVGLRKKEINMLIQYMPENEYQVDLNKIYKAIELKSSEEFVLTFFRSFQNHYTSNDFNRYFSKYIDVYPGAYKILNMKENIYKVWKVWLKTVDIIEGILDQYFRMDKSIFSYLEFLSLVSSSSLYKDCFDRFLLVCKSKDYLNLDEKMIRSTIENFNSESMIEFLNNYLIELEVEEFQDLLLNYIYDRYKTLDDMTSQFIWEKVDSLAREKYQQWVLKKQLFDFFKGDARFEFWYRYISNKEAELIDVNEGQLFLDFGEFVVIEFSEYSNAAYIYDREYFDNEYREYLNSQEIRNNSFYKNMEDVRDRVIHSGNWQDKTEETLRGLKYDTR